MMVTDPVCGMEIDSNTAAAKYDYEGKTYYFCSMSCKESFEKDPKRYLNEQAGGHSRHH